MLAIALCFVFGVLGVVSGAVGAYVLTKKALSHDNILDLGEEFIENILEKAQSDAEFQKRIYVLGGLLGQGIKAGIGFQQGGGGKFKWQDLVMNFVGQKFGLNFNQQQQQQQQPPQTSNIPSA
jgi:hypothetical protein